MASPGKCPYCEIVVDPLDERCRHCGRNLVGKALLTTDAASRVSPRRAQRFFWIISLLAAVLGGLIGVAGVVGATGAPQEAAAAAIACMVIIAPYVFARAVEEILR